MKYKHRNAGDYNQRIKIVKLAQRKNRDGYELAQPEEVEVLGCWAKVKTTRGYTLIASGSDFEKAYTNFTIRFPKTQITRDMQVVYNGKHYTIEYLNDIDEAGLELEIQAKVVVK